MSNKADQFQADYPPRFVSERQAPLLTDEVARHRGVGCLTITYFDGAAVEEWFFVPHNHQAMVAHIYQHTTVMSETHDEQGTHFTVRTPRLGARASA
jgi:hypothetical protein